MTRCGPRVCNCAEQKGMPKFIFSLAPTTQHGRFFPCGKTVGGARLLLCRKCKLQPDGAKVFIWKGPSGQNTIRPELKKRRFTAKYKPDSARQCLGGKLEYQERHPETAKRAAIHPVPRAREQAAGQTAAEGASAEPQCDWSRAGR